MNITGPINRAHPGKLVATAALTTLTLAGLAGLAGPAGANQDTTAPTADPVTTSAPNEHGWHREALGVFWNWSDDESGLSSECEDVEHVGIEGSHAFTAECTDNAGNVGLAGFGINLDFSAPTVTLDPDTSGGTELRFTAADEVSGVDHVNCMIDDEPTERCESPLDLQEFAVGDHYIGIQAVDRASNVSETAYFHHRVYPELPSGSVVVDGVRFAKKRNGDLTITGSQGDDHFFVIEGAEPGHIGIAFGDDGADDLVWSGPVRNLRIVTRNGWDAVRLRRVELVGSLNINLGQGGGEVTVHESTVAGRASIQIGSNRANEGASLYITRSQLASQLTLIGGNGVDGFYVNNSTVAGRLSVRAGAGANEIGIARVEGLTSFDYRGSRHYDRVEISETDLGNRPRILTDGGNDFIKVAGAIDGLTINSGSGNDMVEVNGATGAVVRVSLGAGQDDANAGTGMGEASRFDGGSGEDTYFGPETYVLRKIENVNSVN